MLPGYICFNYKNGVKWKEKVMEKQAFIFFYLPTTLLKWSAEKQDVKDSWGEKKTDLFFSIIINTFLHCSHN